MDVVGMVKKAMHVHRLRLNRLHGHHRRILQFTRPVTATHPLLAHTTCLRATTRSVTYDAVIGQPQ